MVASMLKLIILPETTGLYIISKACFVLERTWVQDMDVSACLSNFTGNLMVHIEHELHLPCVIYVG